MNDGHVYSGSVSSSGFSYPKVGLILSGMV